MRPNWFVGFPVPGDWLEGFLADLPEQTRGFVAGDLHMTVAFLGAVDESRARSLIPLIEEISWPFFEIELGSLLALPKKTRFSALSFSITTGRGDAVQFMKRFRDPWLAHVGARPDDREPLPHITIARPLRKAGAAQREVILEWAKKRPPFQRLKISELALYTWADDRKLAQFKAVYRKTLD